MQMNPYLGYNGDCEEAFEFYAEVLGGEVVAKHTYAGMPPEMQTPPDWKDKIMHSRLVIGDNVLMGSDAPPGHSEKPQGFHVSLMFDDKTEGERVFNALSEGGAIVMPFQQTFWSSGFGMFVDRFGIPWMVNCEAAAG